MYTLAIIQARIGSTRLPGKVLADVNNRPLLWYVVRRAQRAQRVNQVVVAIPDTVEDLAIAALCAAWDVPCVMGPEHDVLARYLMIAEQWQPSPDVIVRITGDCPLIDPGTIDAVVGWFSGEWAAAGRTVAYASNVFPVRTFPDGLDVEAFPVSTLRRLATLTNLPADREHVTPFLHRFPTRFTGEVRCPRLTPSLGDLRWTVDTAEDLAFVDAIFRELGEDWAAPYNRILGRFPFAYRRAA